MIVVDLEGLGKQARPAILYLNSKLDESPKVQGSRVQLGSTKARTVKLLIHKYLHQNALENYRVVISRPDLVEVMGPKSKRKQAQIDSPSILQNNETIPYYQVAAEWGVVPKLGRRKWRP